MSRDEPRDKYVAKLGFKALGVYLDSKSRSLYQEFNHLVHIGHAMKMDESYFKEVDKLYVAAEALRGDK